MEFEDENIDEVNCDESVEISIKGISGEGFIFITDKELLALCRMRGLID